MILSPSGPFSHILSHIQKRFTFNYYSQSLFFSLQAATICSANFPLTNYSVTVFIGNETDTSTYPVSDPRIMDQNVITLPVPSGRLTQDQEYEVIVTACITVTCRTTSPAIPFSKFVFVLTSLYWQKPCLH